MKRVRENINTIEYWDNRFITEGDHLWDPMNIVPHLSKRLPNAYKIIDVGLGGGIMFRKLYEMRADLEYHGCDFSPAAIELLRNRPEGKFFKNLFVYDLLDPVPEEHVKAYDAVICGEVLEHLEEPDKAVERLVAMARNRVIVTVPYRNSIRSPEHIWEFEPEDVEALLKPYGVPAVQGVRKYRNLMGMVVLNGNDSKPV